MCVLQDSVRQASSCPVHPTLHAPAGDARTWLVLGFVCRWAGGVCPGERRRGGGEEDYSPEEGAAPVLAHQWPPLLQVWRGTPNHSHLWRHHAQVEHGKECITVQDLDRKIFDLKTFGPSAAMSLLCGKMDPCFCFRPRPPPPLACFSSCFCRSCTPLRRSPGIPSEKRSRPSLRKARPLACVAKTPHACDFSHLTPPHGMLRRFRTVLVDPRRSRQASAMACSGVLRCTRTQLGLTSALARVEGIGARVEF